MPRLGLERWPKLASCMKKIFCPAVVCRRSSGYRLVFDEATHRPYSRRRSTFACNAHCVVQLLSASISLKADRYTVRTSEVILGWLDVNALARWP